MAGLATAIACHAAPASAPLCRVWHDGQRGVYDTRSSGTVPQALAGIIATTRAQQDAGGGAGSGVDHGFGIPVELAAALTSYRHDRWKFSWGEPRFSVVKPLL